MNEIGKLWKGWSSDNKGLQIFAGFISAFSLEGGLNYFMVYFLNNVNINRSSEYLQREGVIREGVDTELAGQYVEMSSLFFELDIVIFFIILIKFRRLGAACYWATWNVLTFVWLGWFGLEAAGLWSDLGIGFFGGILFLLLTHHLGRKILLYPLKIQVTIIRYIIYLRFLR
jgi:hypothetical protein